MGISQYHTPSSLMTILYCEEDRLQSVHYQILEGVIREELLGKYGNHIVSILRTSIMDCWHEAPFEVQGDLRWVLLPTGET